MPGRPDAVGIRTWARLEGVRGALGRVLRGGNAEVRQGQLVDDRVEAGGHVAGVTEPSLGVAGGRLGDELVELGWDAVNDRTGRGNVSVEARVGDREGVVAREGRCSGQQLEGHHAQGVDIAARPGRGTDDLLGRQVRGRPENHAGGGDAGLGDRPHQPEIDEFHLPVMGNQHVLRFEIAMHQAGPVGDAKAAEHRAQHGHHRVRGHRAPFAQQLAQGAALDEFHHQVGRVVAAVVHRHQTRMLEAGHRKGFPPETGQELMVTGVAGIHHLQCHRPFEPQIEPAVDRRHPAGRDLGVEAVAAVEHHPARVGGGVQRHGHMVGRVRT